MAFQVVGPERRANSINQDEECASAVVGLFQPSSHMRSGLAVLSLLATASLCERRLPNHSLPLTMFRVRLQKVSVCGCRSSLPTPSRFGCSRLRRMRGRQVGHVCKSQRVGLDGCRGFLDTSIRCVGAKWDEEGDGTDGAGANA